MGSKLSFEEKYNLLTGRMFMHTTRLLNHNFKASEIDITKEQWTVLAVLWRHDGVPQQIIADETGRDKPSTTRLLDNLEKLGYIVRRADANDRRVNSIFLTSKGKESEKKIMAVVDETFTTLTDDLTEKQMQNVREVFRTIYSNIEKIQ